VQEVLVDRREIGRQNLIQQLDHAFFCFHGSLPINSGIVEARRSEALIFLHYVMPFRSIQA
jgi:hypothetical protein